MNITLIIIAAMTLTVFALFLFKFFMKKKQRKYEILIMKKYGGCQLTDKEQMFLTKNTGMRFTPSRIKRKRKPLTHENIKAGIGIFVDKLNPWHFYNEELKRLKLDVSSNDSTISYLRCEVNNLEKAIEVLQPKKEKPTVPEFIKIKQESIKNENKSSLDNLGTVSYSKFA